MAQKTVVTLVDDIDGSEADETIGFGLDGITYDIDLSDKHGAELRGVLKKYVDSARRMGGRRATARRSPTAAPSYTPSSSSSTRAAPKIDREQSRAMRDWAARHGATKLGDRGRMPAEVVSAYNSNTPHLIPLKYWPEGAASSTNGTTLPAPDGTAQLDIETTPASAPAFTEPGATSVREWPDNPRELTAEQKRQVAEWAVDQGHLDKPVVSRLTKDILSVYKSMDGKMTAKTS